jgi:predicted ATP-grasp superfamily ATP-dependent carboligase
MLEDDFFSALTAARSGELTFKQWWRSLRGIRETHWFAADDPAPGILWLWRELRTRASARMRRTALAKG